MEYSEDLADTICDLVANGSNLNKIGQMKDMPARSAIYTWMDQHSSFKDKYTRARKDRADWRADNIDTICQDLKNGVIDHQTARILIDAEKWQAGKENGSRYGDKQTIDHQSKGEKLSSPSQMTDEQLLQLINKTKHKS